ncbi:DUF4345 domain-containing protein [uncultured Winogradskyella sp.]|uniref:DUF4345 domain-containing protein n=1 Tax=Winogradskyella sp. 4-2091 TaxID=3381659 RepID=UPI002608074F|nr:DUF4345 domain-containing protein [uncultured Winogradskyella sp.]
MKITQNAIITKVHLVISVLIVVPIAFVYGFNPSSEFDIHLNTIDEHNQFKAVMGLYLGFSIVWILGIFKAKFFKLALTSNIIFMIGLGFGRILSWLIDGTPTFGYQFGAFAEIFLGCYGLWVLISHHHTATNS